MARVHVVGAGVAGLAAAVRLAHAGHAVSVYEAAPRAGGRCRSYHDPQFGGTIDNGNHLVMSGNTAVRAYAAEIGASDQLATPEATDFPFVDVKNGQKWTIAPTLSPWWWFDPRRRAPHTSWYDYAQAIKLFWARREATVAQCLGRGQAISHFWEPLVVAVLNAPLEEAAAGLLRPVLRETVLRGPAFCRPMVAKESLAAALIDPAIARLKARQAEVHFGARVKGFEEREGRLVHMHLEGHGMALGPQDRVVLAVPAWNVSALFPWISVPPPGQAIVNVHFSLPNPRPLAVIGLVGSLAQWLFVRARLASVTISAADRVSQDNAVDIAERCWADLWPLLDMPPILPPYRVIKERRATFSPHPSTLHLRPPVRTRLPNLVLAGDYVQTGLPATLEGAIRSGFAAAEAIGRPNLEIM